MHARCKSRSLSVIASSTRPRTDDTLTSHRKTTERPPPKLQLNPSAGNAENLSSPYIRLR
jgi:hypothetical protein